MNTIDSKADKKEISKKNSRGYVLNEMRRKTKQKNIIKQYENINKPQQFHK